jgi:hypothetical protein
MLIVKILRFLGLLCDHEWLTKRDRPGRVYLECRHCLKKTTEVEIPCR